MNTPNPDRVPAPFDSAELEASLEPLGIREVAERMEVSPLLIDQGDLSRAALVQDQDASICCTCKIPWEDLNEKGQMPYPVVDPPLGSTGGTSGLLTGPIWPY